MTSPFRTVLGQNFAGLLPAVKQVHGAEGALFLAGSAEVTAAANPLARLVGWLSGMPKAGPAQAAVSFTPLPGGRVLWQRRFDGRRYASVMAAGQGAESGLLIEYFGPFRLRFRLTPQDGRLHWSLAGWRLLGLPLPGFTCPEINCIEGGDGQGRFTFDIRVRFPLVGPVVAFCGSLERQEVRSA